MHTGVMLQARALPEWATAVGVRPDTIMQFQRFCDPLPVDHLAKVRQLGIRFHIMTWEPFGVSTADIAAGVHDELITTYAQAFAGAGLYSEYLRFGHEMEGDWYPWSTDPAAYRAAYRRVAKIMRAVAPNVRMVFSPNGNVWQSLPAWLERVRPFFPGPEYVDYFAITAINGKGRAASLYGDRVLAGADAFGIAKVCLPEINTQYEGRVQWLSDLAQWTLQHRDRVHLVSISQPAASGIQANVAGAGLLQWRVESSDDLTRATVAEWYRAALSQP